MAPSSEAEERTKELMRKLAHVERLNEMLPATGHTGSIGIIRHGGTPSESPRQVGRGGSGPTASTAKPTDMRSKDIYRASRRSTTRLARVEGNPRTARPPFACGSTWSSSEQPTVMGAGLDKPYDVEDIFRAVNGSEPLPDDPHHPTAGGRSDSAALAHPRSGAAPAKLWGRVREKMGAEQESQQAGGRKRKAVDAAKLYAVTPFASRYVPTPVESVGQQEGAEAKATPGKARADNEAKRKAKERHQQDRTQRALDAEQCRLAYGETSEEVQRRMKNEQRREEQEFKVNMREAVASFLRRTRTMSLLTPTSFLLGCFFLFSEFPAKDSLNAQGYRDPSAPNTVYVACALGVFASFASGAATSIMVQFLSEDAVISRWDGSAAESFAKYMIHIMYYCFLLKIIALTSFCIFLADGLQDRIVWEYLSVNGGTDSMFVVLKLVMAFAFPIIESVNIVQLRSISISNLKLFSRRAQMQEHICMAIRNSFGGNALMFLGWGFYKLAYVLQINNDGKPPADRLAANMSLLSELYPRYVQLLTSDEEADDDPSDDYKELATLQAQDSLIDTRDSAALSFGLFHFLIPMLIATSLLALTLFYVVVSDAFNKYEDQIRRFAMKKNAAKQSALRVPLRKDQRCRLHHIIDRKDLDGSEGTIVADGVDEAGKVHVELNDERLRVEEWQCAPVADADDAERQEKAALRVAGVDDEIEKHERTLARLQMMFVTLSQVRGGPILRP